MSTVYDFTVKGADGEQVPLAQWRGKALLIVVNSAQPVASPTAAAADTTGENVNFATSQNRDPLALRDRPDRQEVLAGVRMPTLILWGGQARLIPPDTGQQFKQQIAGSQLVVFDDLGHVPQEEDPVRTVVPVKAFLGLK